MLVAVEVVRETVVKHAAATVSRAGRSGRSCSSNWLANFTTGACRTATSPRSGPRSSWS